MEERAERNTDIPNTETRVEDAHPPSRSTYPTAGYDPKGGKKNARLR